MTTSLFDRLTRENGLAFRITHRDNAAHTLEHGLHCGSSDIRNPSFVAIGNPEIIARRVSRSVPIGPCGVLSDYVPFYFTPRTPMLYNIVTGRSVMQRARSEIIILVTDVNELRRIGASIVVADRNAALTTATFTTELTDDLPWADWQASNFKRHPEHPDRFERYQAELLVHRHVSAGALRKIVVHDAGAADRVRAACARSLPENRLLIRPGWYA